jgi:hypothetical protein
MIARFNILLPFDPFVKEGDDLPGAPHAALRVGVWNLPQGVALVTTQSGQTPPASKFVLGFPGFHRHHGNSFGLGTRSEPG